MEPFWSKVSTAAQPCSAVCVYQLDISQEIPTARVNVHCSHILYVNTAEVKIWLFFTPAEEKDDTTKSGIGTGSKLLQYSCC